MRALQHLMKMGLAARAMDNAGNDLTLKNNLDWLKGIPILFLSGSENAVYSPEATDISFNVLRNEFGEDGYERVVFKV